MANARDRLMQIIIKHGTFLERNSLPRKLFLFQAYVNKLYF